MIGHCQGRRVVFTLHAIERYQERVKPWLTVDQARHDLGRLLPLAGFSGVPSWMADRDDHTLGRFAEWLIVGDGIGFPLQLDRGVLAAVTCVTRAGYSDAVRAERSERRRKRRQRVQARSRFELFDTRLQRPRPNRWGEAA